MLKQNPPWKLKLLKFKRGMNKGQIDNTERIRMNFPKLIKDIGKKVELRLTIDFENEEVIIHTAEEIK